MKRTSVLTFLLLPVLTSTASCGSDPDEPASESSSGGSASGGFGGDSSSGGEANSFEICPSHALLCDDFDDDLEQWTKQESGGSLDIDSTFSTSGGSSLLVDIPAGQAGGFLEFSGAPLFPLPDQKMYGRVMVYFEGLPRGHTDIIRGASANAEVPWYNVGHQYGDVLLNYFREYPGVDCWARPAPSYVIPTEQWMCWEWVFDGGQNQLDFYIDGELERSVSQTGDGCVQGGNQVWEAPAFETLLIGAYNAQRTEIPNEGRMWLDDLAVGVEGRLGCPSP